MPPADPADRPAPRAAAPVVTWAMMFLAMIVVVLLPDRAGSGDPRPIWALATPALLGLVGAVFALRGRHPWWAAISALWGLFLIQVLIVVATLISGP